MRKNEIPKEYNVSIGKRYREPWNNKKFFGGFNIIHLAWWGKTFNTVFRIFVVVAIIFGIVYGIGYWQGWKRKPVVVGTEDFVAYVTDKYGVKHEIKCKNHRLYLDDQRINVGNVKALKPFGIDIKPRIFFGVGSSMSAEVGLGAEIAHYFQWNISVFGTQKGAYVGLGYDLNLSNEFLSNSTIGLAVGKSWTLADDIRFLVFWSFKF